MCRHKCFPLFLFLFPCFQGSPSSTTQNDNDRNRNFSISICPAVGCRSVLCSVISTLTWTIKLYGFYFFAVSCRAVQSLVCLGLQTKSCILEVPIFRPSFLRFLEFEIYCIVCTCIEKVVKHEHQGFCCRNSFGHYMYFPFYQIYNKPLSQIMPQV